MKFQTAVAALVAIENLSLVDSLKTNSVGENVWKDAIEVVSDNGKMMRERTNHLQDKLRKLSPTDEQRMGEEDFTRALRSSNSDGDSLDLGILVNEQPIQMKDEYEGKNPLRLNLPKKALRRLQLGGYYDGVDDVSTLLSNPLAYGIEDYCDYLTDVVSTEIGVEACDVCGVFYYEGDSAYNLKMNCPNLPTNQYTEYNLTSLEDACELYCDACSVDVENFVVDLQGCYVEVPDFDIADVLNSPIAFIGNIYCPYLSEDCDICEVVYDDTGAVETYSLNMNCPSVAEEDTANAQELFTGLYDLCNVCEECEVDTENFIAAMEGCNFSYYIDSYFDNVFDEYFGDFIGDIDEIIDADPEDLGELEDILDGIVDADPEDLEELEGILDGILDEEDPDTATDAEEVTSPTPPDPASEAEPATEKPVEEEPVVEETVEAEPVVEETVEEEPAAEETVEEEPAAEETVEEEPASDTSETSAMSESGAYSLGRKSTTVGLMIFTVATASAVQMLLG